jgi:hypothetical protein
VIFSYAESINKYGSKYLVNKAVKTGQLYKQESGIYSDKEYVPAIAVIASKYPDAIFTMNSAFYYYDLTDVIPEKFYLATDRDATKIADKRVVQIFEWKDLLELGCLLMVHHIGEHEHRDIGKVSHRLRVAKKRHLTGKTAHDLTLRDTTICTSLIAKVDSLCHFSIQRIVSQSDVV